MGSPWFGAGAGGSCFSPFLDCLTVGSIPLGWSIHQLLSAGSSHTVSLCEKWARGFALSLLSLSSWALAAKCRAWYLSLPASDSGDLDWQVGRGLCPTAPSTWVPGAEEVLQAPCVLLMPESVMRSGMGALQCWCPPFLATPAEKGSTSHCSLPLSQTGQSSILGRGFWEEPVPSGFPLMLPLAVCPSQLSRRLRGKFGEAFPWTTFQPLQLLNHYPSVPAGQCSCKGKSTGLRTRLGGSPHGSAAEHLPVLTPQSQAGPFLQGSVHSPVHWELSRGSSAASPLSHGITLLLGWNRRRSSCWLNIYTAHSPRNICSDGNYPLLEVHVYPWSWCCLTSSLPGAQVRLLSDEFTINSMIFTTLLIIVLLLLHAEAGCWSIQPDLKSSSNRTRREVIPQAQFSKAVKHTSNFEYMLNLMLGHVPK